VNKTKFTDYKILTNIYRTDHRQLTLWGPKIAGGPLGP